DSLSAGLARAVPLLSRFGRVSETIDGAAAEPLYHEAVSRALAAATNDTQLAHALATVLERGEAKVERLAEQLVEMMGRREQWTGEALEHRQQDDADLRMTAVEREFERIIGDHLARLVALLPKALARNACRIAVATRSRLDSEDKDCKWPTLAEPKMLTAQVTSVGTWKELRALLLTQDGNLRRRVDKSVGATAGSGEADAYKELLSAVGEIPEADREELVRLLDAMTDDGFPLAAGFDQDGRAGLRAFFALLLRAHTELWQVFAETRTVDFSQVATGAIDALGDDKAPSDLLERLDRRIDHILVDEFQDTNIAQCALLRQLTSGWSEDDGRTLFAVGDPMQSIYRFRKAEVGLFLGAAAADGAVLSHLDTKTLRLVTNFRSQTSIVNWVNDHFGPTMGDHDDLEAGTVAYAESKPGPGADDGEPVELKLWQPSDSHDADHMEGEGLAELISETLLPAAQARGGRVACLVRQRRHARPLMDALTGRGTAFSPGDTYPLEHRPQVQDLASLTRFIAHPGDRLSGLALLHSPLVGLSTADLCRLVEADVAAADTRWDQTDVDEVLADHSALARLNDKSRASAERAHGVLSHARQRLGSLPLAGVVEAAWVELGGPTLTGETGLRDARTYLTLLDDIASPAGLDLSELDKGLGRLTDQPATDAGIVFMTMHRAKGLEFDTVVLPALGKTPPSGRATPIAFETDPATGKITIVAPEGPRGRQSDDARKFALLRRRESERERAEDLRLLYVATTRAEKRLVLSAAAPGKNGPAKHSLLAMVWPALTEGELSIQAASPATGPISSSVNDQRLKAKAQLPSPPLDVSPILTLSRPSDTAGDPMTEPTSASRLGPAVGTVVHGWLERIASEGLEAWSEKRVLSDADRLTRALRQNGVTQKDLDTARQQTIAALQSSIADERGRWILGEHEDARCELSLT
ncbi:MAG: UvrD-helicase domain-containing protein, partial [Deltaproteobacteria bacterium]